MTFRVDNLKTLKIKKKAIKLTLIQLVPLFLVLGYSVIFKHLFSSNLIINLTYFTSIVFLAIIFDRWRLKRFEKSNHTQEVILADKSLIKKQDGVVKENILYSEIVKLEETKKGILIHTDRIKRKSKTVHIPNIFIHFDKLVSELKLTISKNK